MYWLHDDITWYRPRLDWHTVPAQAWRTARVMKYLHWVKSPAIGLDPAQPDRPVDLLAIQRDMAALWPWTLADTRLMATWKARTHFLRAAEYWYTELDMDGSRAVHDEVDRAILCWSGAATTLQDRVFLHALLFRPLRHLNAQNDGPFLENIFDPLVALTVVRRQATDTLPIASPRMRGPVAQARRALTRQWTLLRYGLDVEGRGAQRLLLRHALRGDFAGDEFLLMEMMQRTDRHSAHSDSGELFDWLAELPPAATRPAPAGRVT